MTDVPINDIWNEFSQYSKMGKSSSYLESSVMTGTWVFTYPSIYMAHRPIFGQYGTAEPDTGYQVVRQKQLLIRPAGVITLKPEDV
jgi:hypothetical protein